MSRLSSGPGPRLHNVVSYSLALIMFLTVGLWRQGGAPTAGWLLIAALWSVHFARRALESAWLHVYSQPRVPWTDAVTEYVYYWGFAAWISWTTAGEGYALPDSTFLSLGAAVFATGELGNAYCHRMLRALRPSRTVERRIPSGFLFEWISCPHYLFEILTWVGFALATGVWGSVAFLFLGMAILASWARKRHQAYHLHFDGKDGRERYPPERRALIPYVL
jgi:very-long-chain enoyl-CoA reductase